VPDKSLIKLYITPSIAIITIVTTIEVVPKNNIFMFNPIPSYMLNNSVTISDTDKTIADIKTATAMLPFFISAHSSMPCVNLLNTFIARNKDSTATSNDIANSAPLYRNNSIVIIYSRVVCLI